MTRAARRVRYQRPHRFPCATAGMGPPHYTSRADLTPPTGIRVCAALDGEGENKRMNELRTRAEKINRMSPGMPD